MLTKSRSFWSGLFSGMIVGALEDTDRHEHIQADIIIIGGGAAGLGLAQEFKGTDQKVLIIESGGLEERPEYEKLNEVEASKGLWTKSQKDLRIEFHGSNSTTWSADVQRFGVRCRVLGGSTHAWAGKSAVFDPIDLEARDWVPNSGWPINLDMLENPLDRAANLLNLGPNCYDGGLWKLAGRNPPGPRLDPSVLRDFFWQFARSRIDPLDILRMGPEFLQTKSDNIRILIRTTATRINVGTEDNAFQSVDVACLSGEQRTITGRVCVLASGAIENARLLMLSGNRSHPHGLGNNNDLVGRYLMDHPSSSIGHFKKKHIKKISSRFAFVGLPNNGRVTMYMHGLAPTRKAQVRERKLNCAVFMEFVRSPDDPWDALKRLISFKSQTVLSDIMALLSSPGLLFVGLGRILLQHPVVPRFLKDAIVNVAIWANPNFVVDEFETGGVPHKLDSVAIRAICEQPPEYGNRIVLGESVDEFGLPRPKAVWRASHAVSETVTWLGRLIETEFSKAGLPPVQLSAPIKEGAVDDSDFIDMAHTMGTTRMSDSPETGVVDADCKLYGASGVYVAGGSIFPTSGHANPTLMIVAMAIRLADHLKTKLGKSDAESHVSTH